VNDYPAAATAVNHVEPVPRRIRAFLADEKALDTTGALYVWGGRTTRSTTSPSRTCAVICSSQKATPSTAGAAQPRRMRCGPGGSSGPARLPTDSLVPALAGAVRFDWAALDAWFEEDEQVFVHPQPLRTGQRPALGPPGARRTGRGGSRRVGVTVMVLETGLTTRYYINPAEVSFGQERRIRLRDRVADNRLPVVS
jgi:hypothetical protein